MASRYISNIAREASDSLIRAKEEYDYGKKTSDLPGIFHKVAEALPVTQKSLQSVYRYYGKQEPGAEQEDATKTAVSEARACSQGLANIYQEVVCAKDGGRQATYEKLVGGGKPVEVLMKNLLDATLIIAKPPVVTEEQLKALNNSLSAISKLQPAPTNMGAGIHNYGSGPQSIHQGNGPQNISTGGPQFNNSTFGQVPNFDASKSPQRDNGRGHRHQTPV